MEEKAKKKNKNHCYQTVAKQEKQGRKKFLPLKNRLLAVQQKEKNANIEEVEKGNE